MKLSKLTLLAAILSAGLLICAATSFGKAEYTKKEKKSCVTCHVKANSKDLNDVGKCYQTDKSLDKCQPKK